MVAEQIPGGAQLSFGAAVVIGQGHALCQIGFAVQPRHAQCIGNCHAVGGRIRHEAVQHNPVHGEDTRNMVHIAIVHLLALFMFHPGFLQYTALQEGVFLHMRSQHIPGGLAL